MIGVNSAVPVVAMFPASEILPLIGICCRARMAGISFRMNTQRLRLFKDNPVCVGCGIRGDIFRVERPLDSRANPASAALRFYGRLGKSRWVLMTLDHRIPRSKGGANTMSNYQTMCFRCNVRKGDSL